MRELFDQVRENLTTRAREMRAAHAERRADPPPFLDQVREALEPAAPAFSFRPGLEAADPAHPLVARLRRPDARARRLRH